ncbi:hypothetical protein A4X06_0g8714, partial [Tilletia controversa]
MLGGPQVLGKIVRIEEARALGVLPQVPPAPPIQQPMGQVQQSGYQGQPQAQLPQAQEQHIRSIARPASQQGPPGQVPGQGQMTNIGNADMSMSSQQSVHLSGDVSQTPRQPGTPQQHRPGSSATGTETGTPMIQPAMPPMSGLPGAGPSMASQVNPATALPLGMRAPVDQGVPGGPGGHPYAGSHGMSMSNGAMGDAQGAMGPVSAATSGRAAYSSAHSCRDCPSGLWRVLAGGVEPRNADHGLQDANGPLPQPGQLGLPESAYYQPLMDEDIKEMERVMRIDHEYQERFAQQQEWTKAELGKLMDDLLGLSVPGEADSKPRRLGPKLQWWERGDPEIEMEKARRLLNPEQDASEIRFEPFRVVFPRQRELEMSKGTRGPRPTINLSKTELERVASEDEWLVPIRLEIDYEQYKLRETFTWNANDRQLSVQAFAANLCEDYGLPPETFVNLISDSMHAQLVEIGESEGRRAR